MRQNKTKVNMYKVTFWIQQNISIVPAWGGGGGKEQVYLNKLGC